MMTYKSVPKYMYFPDVCDISEWEENISGKINIYIFGREIYCVALHQRYITSAQVTRQSVLLCLC